MDAGSALATPRKRSQGTAWKFGHCSARILHGVRHPAPAVVSDLSDDAGADDGNRASDTRVPVSYSGLLLNLSISLEYASLAALD
jgi:hypothetical protein